MFSLLVALVFLPMLVRADVIYVLSYVGQTVTQFSGEGDAIPPVPLVNTGLDWAYSLTTDGTYLYAGNMGSGSGGYVSKYTLDGAVVNAALATGFGAPYQIVLDGDGDLLIPDFFAGTISKYTTEGVVVNAAFITGLTSPTGITVDDAGNIYVFEAGTNSIRKYNSDGQLITASLFTGLSFCSGLAYNNGYIYLSYQDLGTIGKYGVDGTVIDADLITALDNPMKIAFDDTGHLYVANRTGDGTVGKYLVDGTPVDLNFITGVHTPTAVVYMATPEPVTSVLVLSGLCLLAVRRRSLGVGDYR